MFQHLLLPIDGSERSQRAIDTAIGLASKLGAGITAFIAEPTTPLPHAGQGAIGYVRAMHAHDHETAEHAQRLLDAVKAKAERAGVRCDVFYVHTDQVVAAILDAAQERSCDLIVMATHIHGLFRDLLTPSYTKGVMARGEVPLLVVH